MSAVGNAFAGMLAGAAGTAVLNGLTYTDMAARGRPPSELPDKMVRALAGIAGFSEMSKPLNELNDSAKHRRTGIASLLGYADGLGAGAIFGVIRPAARGLSWFPTGIMLGAMTMLMSEGTATALGQTDPTKWPIDAWIADVVPRCVYGWVTCIVYDRMTA